MPFIPSGEVSRNSGVTQLVYSYTITGVDKASIDTAVDAGDQGIVNDFGSQHILEVWILARTDDVGALPALDITINNSGAAIYDAQVVYGNNVTPTSTPTNNGTKWSVACHGSGGSAGQPGLIRFTIPQYAATVFGKLAESTESVTDAAVTNGIGAANALGFRSSAAVTRIKVAAQGAAKMKVGSTLLVYTR